MTKESQLTNDQIAPAKFRHRFVIMASSPAIRVLTAVIRLYQLTLSPLLVSVFGSSNGCRFTPTCSQYAIEAIREHGPMTGSWLAIKRICRCHPFGRCGHDPVKKANAH